MSRFTVLVVGPKNEQEIREVLAPYYEQLRFPPYIKFTREDKAAEKKRLIKYYRKQLRFTPHDIGLQNKFTALDVSDEEYYEYQIKYYGEPELNAAREPISTYNPNARWCVWEFVNKLYYGKMNVFIPGSQKKYIDWNEMSRFSTDQAMVDWIRIQSNPELSNYVKGTMYDYWAGETKSQYMGRKELFMTPAYILRGKWFERNKAGWFTDNFDCVDREKWIDQYREMLTQVKPDTTISTIECRM